MKNLSTILILLISCLGSALAQDITTGLVAHYPFNGNANDESGFGNNGQLSGTVSLTEDRFGNAESAYLFPSSDGTVALGNLPDFTANGAITISGWIKPMEGGLLAQGIVYSDILNMFFTTSTQTIGFTVTTPEPGLGMDAENKELSYDQWAHVVASYDGLTQKIYINDSLYAMQEGSGFNLVVPASGYFLGSLEGVNGFTGVLDDFRFYNRALSNGDISSLYSTGGWNGSSGTTPTSITTFSFPEQTGVATITSGTIEIEVPIGTDITNLIAEFNLAPGATATIGAMPQVSGETPNDFTNPVTYTITAEDGITTQDWEVTVIFPPLVFSSQTLPMDYLFGDASLTASVSMDETSGVTVTTYYRSPLASSYDSTPLTNDAGTFEFEITNAIMNIEGLEYYLEASRNSEMIYTDTTLITFKYTSETSPDIPDLSFGGKLNNWRMFSIPVILEDNRVASIFGARLGTYDKSIWRFVHYKNDTEKFIEYPQGLSVIERGKGYWFNAITITDIPIGAGKEPGLDLDNPYTMNLQPGWNQIGNPYNIDIDWPAVISYNDVTGIEGLKVYIGGTELETSNTLKAYEGAYVKNQNANTIQLSLPLEVLSNGSSRRKPYWTEDLSWHMMLEIVTPNLTNRVSGLGMHPEAREDSDFFDQSRVPRFYTFVDLTFTHAKDDDPSFSYDIAPDLDEHFWDFKIETNELSGPLSLSWKMEDVSLNKEFRLVDLESGTIINMLDINYYSWPADDYREFRIVFGTEEFVRANAGFSGIVLGNNYPNPFNTKTLVPYSLYGEDETYDVEIVLFNGIGSNMISLYKGVKSRGDHMLSIDTSELIGLSNGMYFYQLRVNSNHIEDTVVKKMILNR